MEIGTFSEPIAQASRSGGTVYRIFHLIDKERQEMPEFDEVSDTISNQLYQEAYIRENEAYMAKLRKQYGIDEEYLASMIPKRFEPYSL